MKEIEILVEVYSSPESVIERLERFDCSGTQETIDTYYYDPLRKNLKPNDKLQINECLRLRTKNDNNYITYKVDHFDENDKWLYSDEYETKINDIFTIRNILEKLGLKKLLSIHNSKRIYHYKSYEIAFETVEELGYFLEVEYCTNAEVDIKKIKSEIQSFINSLGINVSEELTMGKPEMIIKKNNISVD